MWHSRLKEMLPCKRSSSDVNNVQQATCDLSYLFSAEFSGFSTKDCELMTIHYTLTQYDRRGLSVISHPVSYDNHCSTPMEIPSHTQADVRGHSEHLGLLLEARRWQLSARLKL